MRSLLLWCVVGAACQSSKAPVPEVAPPPAVAPGDAALPDVAFGAPAPTTIDEAARAAQLLAALAPSEADAARAYAKLLGALASCKPTSFGDFDKGCPAYAAVSEERTRHYEDAAWLPVERAALWLNAGTSSAMVRKVLAERAADDPGDADLLAVVITRETDPHELGRLVGIAYGGAVPSSPALVHTLVERGSFPNQEVRRMSMWALANLSPRPPGVNEALVKVIETDPDPYVRDETCKAAGFLADDGMLAVFDRLLVSTTDASLYDSCFSGLVWMWWPSQNANQKAYARTLALVAKGRHDTQMTAAWNELESFAEDLDREDASRKPFVKLAELRAALAVFITDTAGNQVGRAGAVDVFAKLKASKAELRALLAKLPADEPWSGPRQTLEGGGYFQRPFLDNLVRTCVEAALAGRDCERTVDEAAHEVWKVSHR